MLKFIAYVAGAIFVMGWLNVTGNPHLTWWGAIAYMGNM